MCKEDFQVPGCFPFSLGLGKITQALVKLYPSKYSHKSKLYLWEAVKNYLADFFR